MVPTGISPKKIRSLVRDALISRVFDHLSGLYIACWAAVRRPSFATPRSDGWR
jgi:hypothetical protein